MSRCLFPIRSRTAARLPAALFIGNVLHSVERLERRADGYEAVFSGELQAHIDGETALARGIAISDLDAPRGRPLLYSRAGWGAPAAHQPTAESIAHDLAVASLRPADLWPIDSMSTRLVTLLAMGCDPDALAHATFIDLLERPADADGLRWLSAQLRRRPAQVSEALLGIMGSDEFRNLRHSLSEPRGAATEMFVAVARYCRAPGYKQGWRQPPVVSLADYSPAVALTGGWWKPDGSGAGAEYWSGYSAAVVIRPPAAGRWTFRAVRSAHDAGLAISRWRITGDAGLRGRLVEAGDAVELAFESPDGLAFVLEFETGQFFIPSTMAADSQDHRALALCFRRFDVEATG